MDAAAYALQQQQLQQQQVQHQLLQQQPTNYALPKPQEQPQQQQQHHPAVIVQYQEQLSAAAAAQQQQQQAVIPQDVRSLVTNVLAQQEMETTTSQLSQATQQLIPAAVQPQLLPHDVRSLLLQQIGANGAAAVTAYDPGQTAATIQPAFLNNEFIGYFNPQAAAVQRVIVQQEQQPTASDFSAIANHRPT